MDTSAIPEKLIRSRAQTGFRSNLLLLSPTFILFFIVFMIPIIILLISSFHVNDMSKTLWEKSYTFDNYVRFFQEPYFIQSILKTVWYAVIIIPISIVVGYIVAYFIFISKGFLKITLITLVLTPSFSGVLLQSLGLYIIFSRFGPVNALLLKLGILDVPHNFLGTGFAVVLALVHGFLPFMVLTILNSLRTIPTNIIEASKSLGANSIITFLKVTLPLTKGGILAGSVLVFGGVIGSFSTLVVIGQSKVQLVGLVIYQQAMKILDWPFASVISVFLVIVLILGVMALTMIAKMFRGGQHA
ncbi:ABC transporter permease [Paenibacillus endoradicis]|uniref:ABC transporter permease n=1 Tax=Paenibacillus endoradicis TaxID=2972487 RepID=UPI00215950BB|nr:ABC transporter permease [Paenibacillus endoradicis]MCR8657142.1 ABC transporter permease [Paenibacillus endoradicis]